MTQEIDYDSGNFIGQGETTCLHILKHLTGMQQRGLKHFPYISGIYRQIPIEWLVHAHDFKLLSQPQQRSSIDLLIKLEQLYIAVRVQGDGHGSKLKGLGKARFDVVQKKLLQKYCSVVDINKYECPTVFKNKVTQKSIDEVIMSFNTANVLIPCIRKD